MATAQDIDAILAALAARAGGGLDQAAALPPGIYTSGDVLAREETGIFARDWLCPGLAAEIPEAGDYLTFSIGAQPVFCVRGSDGVIRSFANVCRHRRMQLLEGRGQARRVVCPYHAWTYDLKGQLIGAPHMEWSTGFKKGDICLPEIRTEIWEGWIYITLDADAPPVADRLKPLQKTVARFAMENYVPVVTQDHVWQTNWKLICENFMEGYHLPVAHKKTVGAWFPADQTHFPAKSHGGFTYQSFGKTPGATYGRAHKSNKRLRGKWRGTSLLPSIFPAHMYVLAPDHLWYLSLRPKGPGQTDIRFGIALAPEVYDSLEDLDGYVAEMTSFFSTVNEEDRTVTEGIYRGAQAPLSTPGQLSWLERELHDFMKYLASRLMDTEAGKGTP